MVITINPSKLSLLLMVITYYMRVMVMRMDYLDKIRPYLTDLIDFYNTKGEWKVQLSMSITFVSYINPDQVQLMHSKSFFFL